MSESKYDWNKPLGQRRPKVMERMPDPPKSASFEIDDRKLESVTEPHDGEWWEGFKWGGWILAIVGLFIGAVVLLLVSIARALP